MNISILIFFLADFVVFLVKNLGFLSSVNSLNLIIFLEKVILQNWKKEMCYCLCVHVKPRIHQYVPTYGLKTWFHITLLYSSFVNGGGGVLVCSSHHLSKIHNKAMLDLKYPTQLQK
jgi:hypothetical protein